MICGTVELEQDCMNIYSMACTALIAVMASIGAPICAGVTSPSLEEQFANPPVEARPRVWWHWMNGNITKAGIARDLEWMKRVGIAGVQNFDASMATPQIVEERLIYMTPQWQEAFRFATSEADRLGLELAIASSPGFTETGGPWVEPRDGMKKLVWSEVDIVAGKSIDKPLASPPSMTGPFQTIPADPTGGLTLVETRAEIPGPFYADVAVLAWPVPDTEAPPKVTLRDGAGKGLDAKPLDDDDLTSTIEIASVGKRVPELVASYADPYTVRSARLFVPHAAGRTFGPQYAPILQASDDSENWWDITSIPLTEVPTTVSFASVTANYFRVLFKKQAAASIPVEYLSIMQRGLDTSTSGGGAATAMMGGGKTLHVADFRLFGEARIDQVEAKAAFTIARDYYALGTPVEESGIARRKIRNLTSRLAADGTLDWQPPRLPEGQKWRVLRLGYSLLGTMNHPAPVEATGLEVDKYDGAAVRRYMEHYIGMYRDTVGEDLIGQRGVRALLNDSIEAGEANWTPRLVEEFRQRRGYDPTTWLPALTGTIIESRARSDAFLYDFRRTLSELMASEHYGTIADVAHENGMIVYGEAQEDQRPNLGDDMAMRQYADIPMAALWTFERKHGPKPTYLADMRGAASVANIYGRDYVAAESMTSLMAPWAFGPRDLKRIVDLEFALGINRPVIHTSVHVPTEDRQPGLTLSMFGQYFNRNESWAELATPWVNYLARHSLMLQKGKRVVDVGYFYGEEGPLTGLYGEQPVTDAPTHYAYDFVNADALLNVLGNDGGDIVSPGGARYRTLYLGGASSQMTLPVLRKLESLVRGGATLIGERPIGNPGLMGKRSTFDALVNTLWPGTGSVQLGKGQVIASNDVDAVMRQLGVVRDFYFEGATDSEVLYLHRKWEDGDSYFVNNRSARVETGEAHFRVTGRVPELFQPETGAVRPLSYRIEKDKTVVPLTLAPDEAVHIVFRQPALAESFTVEEKTTIDLGAISGEWDVRFEPGRGAPATTKLKTLAPLNESRDPGIRYFSGIATYSNEFFVPGKWQPGEPLWLDLGEAREVAEVIVNGERVGYVWNSPYRIDITRAAQPGRNNLEIRVANLWVNRMIGDKQPGQEPITWASSVSYSARAPLRRSGLIGPVRLVGVSP